MSKPAYTAEEVIAALEDSYGIQTVVARRLGCSRRTVSRYLHRYPTVREAWLDERGRLRDKAESKLAEKVAEGSWKAIAFTLTHLDEADGRIRPPAQRLEHANADGEELLVRFVWTDTAVQGERPEDTAVSGLPAAQRVEAPDADD